MVRVRKYLERIVSIVIRKHSVKSKQPFERRFVGGSKVARVCACGGGGGVAYFFSPSYILVFIGRSGIFNTYACLCMMALNDEMGLHCLQKCAFRRHKYTKNKHCIGLSKTMARTKVCI